MEKKFELTDIVIEICGLKLFRIKALKPLENVEVGELGGYIEKKKIYLKSIMPGYMMMPWYTIMHAYAVMLG